MTLEKNDARLKDAVLKALRNDVRVNEAEIGVAVEDGVVTLTGRVETQSEKAAAQDAVHHTAGVLDVANDIHVKVPFALGRSDTDLAQDVRRTLDRTLQASAGHVHSTVEGAWVTLQGAVEDAREREAAERAVRRLAGVQRVDNRIAVRLPARQSPDSEASR